MMDANVASNTETLAAVGLAAVAAIGALVVASITWLTTRETRKAARGQTFLSCLERYTSIMRDRTKAITDNDPTWAEVFYRELFDLHWSEFHIWQEGVIPDKVMRAWLYVRQRNYWNDRIECRLSDGTTKVVTYRDQWDALKSQNYFEVTDPFVRFMDKGHAGEISNLKKLRKDTKE